MKAKLVVALVWFVMGSAVCAWAQSDGVAAFNQAVAELQKNPENQTLRESVVKMAVALTPPPAVPEEAKRHFARGAAIAKEALRASRPADDELAINEYRQAIALAPWLGNAYYNLSGLEEAAGQFDEATANLKLYLLTKPADANDAQDHLYAIEAEKDLAAKHNAEREAAEAVVKADADWKNLTAWLGQEATRLRLAGPWHCETFCKYSNLDVSSDSFEGTVTFATEKDKQIVVGVRGQLKAGVVVGGRASFPTNTDGVCDFPADEQPITGTLSEDGGNLNLHTFQQVWVGYHQGLAIFAKCVSTTTQGTYQIDFQLGSNAPPFVPLHAAVGTGQLASVKLVLAHGGDVNATTVDGKTALYLAAAADNWDIVKLLLESGAQANRAAQDQTTPLHIAAQRNNYGIVRLLLDHGAQVGVTDASNETPLARAVKANALESAKLLAEHGANPNVANKDGLTPLSLSVHNVQMAKLMLAHAGKIDVLTPSDGVYPLFVCDDNTTEVTQLLFDQGADVNFQDAQGVTPLAVAAGKNNVATAKLLLARGAKVEAADKNGIYPLMNAAESGNMEMVKLLIASGAHIDVTDLRGRSVLWYAKEGRGAENSKRTEGNKATIEFFKEQGLKK